MCVQHRRYLRRNYARQKWGGFSSEFELDERALESMRVHDCKPLSNLSDVKGDVRMGQKSTWVDR